MDIMFEDYKQTSPETNSTPANEVWDLLAFLSEARDKMIENLKITAQETIKASDDFINNAKSEMIIEHDDAAEKYMSSKKELIFQNIEALQQVENVVNEAAMAVNDDRRTLRESAIPEVLAGALGAGFGSCISFSALYGLGTVGLSGPAIMSGLATAGEGLSIVLGGALSASVAGIFVLATPIAVLSAGGVALATNAKQRQLKQEKERLYKEALAKHEAIIEALHTESKANKERLDYLQSLNILLQRAIKDLKQDLGIEGKQIS